MSEFFTPQAIAARRRARDASPKFREPVIPGRMPSNNNAKQYDGSRRSNFTNSEFESLMTSNRRSF